MSDQTTQRYEWIRVAVPQKPIVRVSTDKRGRAVIRVLLELMDGDWRSERVVTVLRKNTCLHSLLRRIARGETNVTDVYRWSGQIMSSYGLGSDEVIATWVEGECDDDPSDRSVSFRVHDSNGEDCVINLYKLPDLEIEVAREADGTRPETSANLVS